MLSIYIIYIYAFIFWIMYFDNLTLKYINHTYRISFLKSLTFICKILIKTYHLSLVYFAICSVEDGGTSVSKRVFIFNSFYCLLLFRFNFYSDRLSIVKIQLIVCSESPVCVCTVWGWVSQRFINCLKYLLANRYYNKAFIANVIGRWLNRALLTFPEKLHRLE